MGQRLAFPERGCCLLPLERYVVARDSTRSCDLGPEKRVNCLLLLESRHVEACDLDPEETLLYSKVTLGHPNIFT